MIKKSFGKINFNLNIYEKQSDGFHFMQSYMQKVSLYDEIHFDFLATKINVQVERYPQLKSEDNIIHQATKLYFKHANIKAGLGVKLQKNIFMSAGMAGGSSNAAACLMALNEHYKVFDFKALYAMACQLGSDVPFFLYDDELMHVKGRGIVCSPQKKLQKKPLLLVNPNIPISTATIYKTLNRSHTVLTKYDPKPIHSWLDMFAMMKHGNDMQVCAEKMCPAIQLINTRLSQSEGCIKAQMSGSGATVWAVFDDEDLAVKAGKSIKSLGNVIFTWTGTKSCFKRFFK